MSILTGTGCADRNPRPGREWLARPAPGAQRGSIMVVAVISLVALFGLAALALDGGHVLLNKTRLQNAVDAAALSAAKTLEDTGDTLLAEQAGRNTFDQVANSTGSNELAAALDSLNYTTEFSDTLFPFVPGSSDPAFVRVIVTNVDLQPFFMVALGLTDKRVSARAVAGRSPALDNEVCDVVPMLACGEPDNNPDDGVFYGYDQNKLHVLKTASGDTSEVGPGNFQLIRLPDGQGGADLRRALAGGYDQCLTSSEPAQTEPGNTVGPVVQGLNLRMGQPSGPLDPNIYKPDYVTDHPSPGLTYENGQIYASNGAVVENAADLAAAYPVNHSHGGYYSDQYAFQGDNWDPNSGRYERRILTVPIGNCSGTTNGQGEVQVYGFGCVFLLQPVVQQGNQAQVFAEFLEQCDSFGNFSMDPGVLGPTRIILYKDPDSQDS